MVYTNYNSSFPDQVVPDSVKNSYDYGLRVAQAIENEWFRQDIGGDRYLQNYQNYHSLRLYARGEQPVSKYKDELSINGDLSYLNLDWKIVPVIPKFVDIVVNGMTEKGYKIKSFATDPFALKERTRYAASIMEDMYSQSFVENIKQSTGADLYNTSNPENLPKSKEELDLVMQLSYKQAVEIAEEELIENVFNANKYKEDQRRIAYDLAVLGIGCSKTSFNLSEGVTVDYVDPASIVYSYTEDPNFEDIYYVGEVKNLSLAEVKRQFSNLTDSELEEIQKFKGPSQYSNYVRNFAGGDDSNLVSILFFEYKTYTNQVFKIKRTEQGLEKTIEKDDLFDPPENDNFERVSRSIEVLYTGAKVLGMSRVLDWKFAENMTRPFSDTTKVNMNYSISAPRMYKGRVDSLVNRITSFADMIQLTHLKLQQVLSRVVPDGVYLDMDGLAEVDLGNGTNYNPAEALNMYFQTGSIVGRSLTQDGELNRGKVPIQELQSSSGLAKIQALIQTYQYYLQMIRDTTGLNEARDGSSPDKNALVGLQKMAAANSNTATRHILKSLMYITIKTAENISLRVNDALQFPLTRESLLSSINTFNVATLEEIENVCLHDFGIFLELEPDEEEKAQLEQNIQVSLQQGNIDLEDAIDIRQVNNLKLANQLLKVKRTQKQKRDQEIQQANIAAQGEANAKASEAAALAEVQKGQALAETKMQLEKAKSDYEIQRMEQEALIKKQLMAEEFNYQMQLAQIQAQATTRKEQEIEDRKDERVKIQGTQQSELIDQRKNDLLPKNFESSGNDNLSGFGLEQFGPR
jgi:hypothetical protein